MILLDFSREFIDSVHAIDYASFKSLFPPFIQGCLLMSLLQLTSMFLYLLISSCIGNMHM